MSFDLKLFSSKLSRYRQQFQIGQEELSEATGIDLEALKRYESGTSEPSGDEILILADFYKCDYKFFISNQQLAPFEQTELLFRRHGDQLSKIDRWNIQEFLFLCECENDLLEMLGRKPTRTFAFTPRGNFYKGHGEQAASKVREFLGYMTNQLTENDVFRDFRQLGVHIFRRKLENSKISGLFLRHPLIGKCVLVNYSEDVYRQRFTAAHEAGHSILDDDVEFNVSLENTPKSELREVRANTFASRYLLPPNVLRIKIPSTVSWNEDQVINLSNQLQVNPQTLAIALEGAGIINTGTANLISSVKIPRTSKSDPELPADLSPQSLKRRQELLQRGLSSYFVGLCFDAYSQKLITRGRLAEMLLVNENELPEIEFLFQLKTH